MDFRSFVKWYWNPLLLSVGLCGYITMYAINSTIDVEPGSGAAILIVILAIPFISVFWAWLVALLQAGWGIRCLFMNRALRARHNIISAVWVACCYVAWIWLISLGCILLA